MEFSKTCSMQFLANVVRILPKKLLFLCPVALLSLSVPFSVVSSAEASTDTSVVCYFKLSNGGTTWQWGLRESNDWYQLGGRWINDNGNYRFETSTSRDEIIESCRRSQRYYNRGELTTVHAANSSLGSNYPIIANGQEVKL